ncbi:unnamed protein product, partial [Adineta steineri]
MKKNNYSYYPLKDEDLNIAITTTASHNATNNTLIWLDEEALNFTSHDTNLTIAMFESIADINYKLYNNLEIFLEEIGSMSKITKLIVVTSGSFAKKMLPKLSLSLLREISSILIFCKDSTNCQYLQTECRKIMDICTDEQSLKESIENELHPSTDFLLMDRNLQPIFKHIHKQNQSDTPLTVFRGHGNMTMDQFEKLKENIGALISFNGFLSTTSDYNVALMFAGPPSTEEKSVIYEIRTNYSSNNVVFADITQLSDMEDEKEFLFSLCSIFRIDDIINDEENQLSKIIMSAVDEDAVNILEQMKIEIIQEEKKHFFDGVIFGINIKLKDKTSSLDNCVGLGCTTTERHSTLKTETSASKRTEPSILTTSPTPIIPSISTYIRTNGSATPSSEYCFPVGWESIGDEIINQGNYRSFTVDDDSNVYVTNRARQSLEKWSFSNKLIQRYFDGNFDSNTPLFYHSLSQSVYFCYTWDGYSGIYRLDGDHSKPRNVLNNTMSGIGQYRIESLCDGLYVNSGGDIFVLFRVRSHVVKWTVNNPTGILV